MTIQDAKENFIIDVAKDLFLSRSISLVTIKDIAKEAGVGEMTIYRYFGKKRTIVILVAMKLQKEVASYYDLSKGNTGLEKLEIFYNSYLNIFNDSSYLYQFINEFDSYMIESNEGQSLSDYEESLIPFKKAYLDAYELGLNDKSIREIGNIDVFYYASTHALIELCKKLSHGEGLLEQDKRIEKQTEIKTLINIFLSYLKNS